MTEIPRRRGASAIPRGGRAGGSGRHARAAVLAIALALPLLAPGPGRADTDCTTRGTRTYCDDGRAYYRYGKSIVSNDGRRWRTFDSHTYGDDGSWIAKHGKGRYTGSYRKDPGDEARILPDILDDADGDPDD